MDVVRMWLKSLLYVTVCVSGTGSISIINNNNNNRSGSIIIVNGTTGTALNETRSNDLGFVNVLNDAEFLTSEGNGTSGLNSSTGSMASQAPTTKAPDYLGFVMEPIFFTTGVLGNSLTIAVMRSQKFAPLPVSLTLTCMAISDMMVTIMHPFNRPFFRKLIKFDIRSASGDAGCKLFFFVWRTAKMTSSWFVVFVCVERFVAVWFPLKVKQISTKRNTRIGLLIIYVGIGSITGAWTFASGLKNGVTCVPDLKLKGLESLTSAFLYAGSIVYSGLPTVIMIISTILIIWKLVAQRKLREQMSSTGTNLDKETMKITTMLVGVTIAYLLLVNPHAIMHNVSFALGKDFFETMNPALKTGRQVAQVLEQINYSINFFLYVLCSRQFRQRVAAIIGLSNCRRVKAVKAPGTRSTGVGSSGHTAKQEGKETERQI